MKLFPSGRRAWFRFLAVWLTLALAAGGMVLYMTAMPGHSFSAALPPLTSEETEIKSNLTRHVNVLAGGIGERNVIAYQSLQKGAQYIEDELKKLGFQVQWQEYMVQKSKASNLIVEIPGGAKASQTGEKGKGKKGQRPEYISKYGYDTKAAMHGLRLLYECLELMVHRYITLPRPEKDLLIEVRSGEWKFERVLAEAKRLEKEVRGAIERSPLPERVDRRAISRLIAQVHLGFWKQP